MAHPPPLELLLLEDSPELDEVDDWLDDSVVDPELVLDSEPVVDADCELDGEFVLDPEKPASPASARELDESWPSLDAPVDDRRELVVALLVPLCDPDVLASRAPGDVTSKPASPAAA